MDPDFVLAAAERDGGIAAMSKDELRDTLAAIPELEKTELLLRIVDGDPHVAAELRSRARPPYPASTTRRTAGELRNRAREIAEAREWADAERREAELRRQAEEAEEARRSRLIALRRRGESVWREIETEIERRNAPGYERAASLLFDLHALAQQEGSLGEFNRRLTAIRARHEKKDLPETKDRASRNVFAN